MDKKNSAGWKVIERARRKSPPSWGAELLGKPQRGGGATAHQYHTGPGGKLNRKLKDKWEALRRKLDYRQDRDTAYLAYVDRLRRETLVSGEGMSPDEVQAQFSKTILSPNWREEQFKKDWPEDKLISWFDFSPEGREVARKWGLEFPFDYDDPLWNPKEESLPPVFRDPLAVQVIPHAPTELKGINDEESLIDQAPHLEAKRYLTLKIDLSKPKTQINYEIDYYYEHYLSFVLPGKKKKVRGKSISADDFCWKVWNMHHKQEKSAWQITKELYPDITSKYSQPSEIDGDTEGGVDGGTDRKDKYTPEAKKARRYWRKVERSIERAQEKIDSLNPTI